MACEKKGVHDVPSVVCTVPPYPEKEERSDNNQTRLRVLGVVTVVAIVVAGVMGVAFLVSHSSSPGGSSLDGSNEDHTPDGNRKEVLVQFNFEGKVRNELINVDKEQNLVTIIDANAGFSVTQDYERGIAMIKNTTSSDCFFTHLEYILEDETIEMGKLKPIVVQEIANTTSFRESDDETTISLLRSDVIPWEYVQVTNKPAISKQCIDSTSYWLKGNRHTSRVRRLAQPGPVPTLPPASVVYVRGVIIIFIQC